MSDRKLIQELLRLYAMGDELGDTGGSARDDMWDLLDKNLGRILKLAEYGAINRENK